MFRVELASTKLGMIKRQSSPKTKRKSKALYAGKRIDWDLFRNRAAIGGKVDQLYKKVTGEVFHVGRVYQNVMKKQ